MVLDFRRGRSRIQPTPTTIGGTEVELVTTISTLVCSLTVSWTGRAIWRRCTARGNLFFKEVIWYLSTLALQCLSNSGGQCSVLCCGLLGWRRLHSRQKQSGQDHQEGWLSGRDWTREGSAMAEARTLNKLRSILTNPAHPIHHLKVVNGTFSQRLITPMCKWERYRKSSKPATIRLFNAQK